MLLLSEIAELRAIAQGLSAIAPAKALWKLSDSDLVILGNSTLTLGSNVKTVKWAPQNDVLGHPNVKAFYTQGGANSFNEVGNPLFQHMYSGMNDTLALASNSLLVCPLVVCLFVWCVGDGIEFFQHKSH